MTREMDQMVTELRSLEDRKDHLERSLDEANAEIEIKKKEAQLRIRTQEEQEREVAAFRREIDMKDIEIKLHDAKIREFKQENTKIRM